MHRISLQKLICICLFIMPVLCLAQTSNHTFPRTAIWQTGGAPADWAARFDLISIRPQSSQWVSEVRRLNPKTMILFMKDMNKAYEGVSGFASEWYLYDSRGNKIELYGPDQFWVNLSDVCPRVGGQQCIDFLPGYYADMISEVEGFSTDGLYHRMHLQYDMWDDVDMDRNGVNDLNEHGKDWVINHWANGVDRLLADMRSAFGNKVIILNTGSPDTPGAQVVNGYISEHTKGAYNWQYDRNHYNDLDNQVFQPGVFLMNNDAEGGDPDLVRPTKDYFSYVRFGLVRAMLLGHYYEYEDMDFGQNEHYWNKYYDEFDLDIGHPTSEMQMVGNETWVRFFQQGVAIANISGSDQTVSDSNLRGLSGYAGPYYRFKGSQDPDFNNGQQFGSITLNGYGVSKSSGNMTIGDAIILVKTPQSVVSDIIIDNVEMGTSPGSEAVNLSGAFQQEEDCSAGDNYYSIRCSWNPGTYPYAVASSGSGEATFIPVIGVAGNYEVFEWHGSLPGSQASSCNYLINHSGGRTTKNVNQTTNRGKWNSLGVYNFRTGSSGNVTVTIQGANGAVMADAISFVFRDVVISGDGDDTIPPVPPTNVKVNNN